MDADRLGLQMALFHKALAALQEAVASDSGDKKSRDSILLSYVFTFEMAWKSLRAALSARGLLVPDYAAAVLRGGFQAGLIKDADTGDWLRFYRNDVSHAYDQAEQTCHRCVCARAGYRGIPGTSDATGAR